MDTLGERLRAARNEKKLTQRDLAEVAGRSKQAISRIESGDTAEPASATLEPICRKLGLNLRWLLYRKGPQWSDGDDVGDEKSPIQVAAYEIREVDEGECEAGDVLIDIAEVDLSAGDGLSVPEYVPTTHKLAFSRRWLQKKHLKPSALRVMPVHGDSMLPTISGGDTVLIDTEDTRVIDGKIYALVLGREAKIKRLRWSASGSLVIMSDSQDKARYPDEVIEAAEADQIYVIGRAVQRSGDL